MKTIPYVVTTLLAGALWLGSANAAEMKTYQVTGPVLAVTPTTITVEKGKEKWEIERTKDTKMTAEPKVGDKVTVHYQMLATQIETKEPAKKK